VAADYDNSKRAHVVIFKVYNAQGKKTHPREFETERKYLLLFFI
jgi:hypothetical protein